MVGGRRGARTTNFFCQEQKKKKKKKEKKNHSRHRYLRKFGKTAFLTSFQLWQRIFIPLQSRTPLKNSKGKTIQELQNCAIHTVMRIHSI